VLLPIGLVVLARRRAAPDALGTLLRIAAVAVFVTLLLRFIPAAWETGTRAGEFLYIGLALVAGVGAERILRDRRWGRPALAVSGLAAALLLAGGIVTGWPYSLRLPQPFEVRVEGRTIQAAGVQAALWARELEPRPFVADETNARLLEAYGRHRIYPGSCCGVTPMLEEPDLADWQRERLQEWGRPYVLVDGRRVAWDNMAGYFFTPPGTDPTDPELYFSAEQYGKFERLGADRLLDGGFLALYDTDRILREPDAAE
jgi:hypothetical protein